MTDARWQLVFDGERELNALEIKEGWHFCNDWDGLLVGPEMAEYQHCRCGSLRTPESFRNPEGPAGNVDWDFS